MPNKKFLFAVNGTLMRGLELENNLKEARAAFIKESQTKNCYRLFSVNDRYPAMIEDKKGHSIALELYEIDQNGLELVLAKEPKGLYVGDVKLSDGNVVKGMMGSLDIIKGQKEITECGGWRNYLARKKKGMKKLFIYYSYTGNGDVVADSFKEKGYDIRKIETVKNLPKSFFWSMMVGGFQASIKKKAKLKEFDQDLSSYDEVVIGSPIWNARFAPATNTILSLLNFSEKKVSFVLYSGSGTGKYALKRIEKEFPHANVVFLKQPKDYPEELKKLDL